MTIIHVHTDRRPHEALIDIEARCGLFRKVIYSSHEAPALLAIYSDLPRAHIASVIDDLPETILPDMNNPDSLKPTQLTALQAHAGNIGQSDTVRSAFAKIHAALRNGPIHEFNPDFF